MGMYDTVNYECDCPICGEKVSGFQTKDGNCFLDTVDPSQVSNFYTSCGSCGSWVEFFAQPISNFRVIANNDELKKRFEGDVYIPFDSASGE